MISPRAGWWRAASLASMAIGTSFLLLGLLSAGGIYFQTSGTTRVMGTVKVVQPPATPTDMVHLIVDTGAGPVRVATNVETPSDFVTGVHVAVLTKPGSEPLLDDGSDRYVASLVLLVVGLAPLAVGIGIWRNRKRLLQKPSHAATANTP